MNKKPSRVSDEDRISKLPDSLLQHILSFVSTKDAIRTGILSLRWLNLWMLVPCLDLDTEQFSDEDDFFNFMDRFLDLRGNSQLQKFKVKYNLFEPRNSCFKLWIDAAIKCKVEHLEFESFYVWDHDCLIDDGVKTPQSLCICNTLVVLKLDGVYLHDVPMRVSLSNLKILHLHNIMYADDISFNNFIAGCSVLEELNIYRTSDDGIKVLCIFSRTLKQLILGFTSFARDREYGLVIDAPNLEYLKLDDEATKSFTITHIGPSSLKACLHLGFDRFFLDELKVDDFSMRNSICRLLTGISNARSLIIHFETFELLCQYRKFEALPRLFNLIHLEAQLSHPACKMLPAILECCPNLKTLILTLVDTSEADPLEFGLHTLYATSESNPHGFSSVAPQHMLSSLESITLRTVIHGRAIEMNMIKYFLENSVVLKEMKFYLSKHLKREKEFLILKELLICPRLSKTCQVNVDRWRFPLS